jgi:hypothetical protein
LDVIALDAVPPTAVGYLNKISKREVNAAPVSFGAANVNNEESR